MRGLIYPLLMLTNALGPVAAAVPYVATGSYKLIFSLVLFLWRHLVI